MTATLAQIADAVQALLDANLAEIRGPINAPIATERVYVPEVGIEDLAEARLTVVPSGVRSTRESRAGRLNHHSVDVGLRARCDVHDRDALDALLETAERVATVLAANTIETADLGKLHAIELATDPIYSIPHLQEQGVFLSVVRATYPARRAP